MVACTTQVEVSRRTKEDRNKTNGRNSNSTDFCFASFALSHIHTIRLVATLSHTRVQYSLLLQALLFMFWLHAYDGTALSCTWNGLTFVCRYFWFSFAIQIQFHMSNVLASERIEFVERQHTTARERIKRAPRLNSAYIEWIWNLSSTESEREYSLK